MKIYIPLSLVHLIYTAGDKCMRQNACISLRIGSRASKYENNLKKVMAYEFCI